jgi:hypothetical protein
LLAALGKFFQFCQRNTLILNVKLQTHGPCELVIAMCDLSLKVELKILRLQNRENFVLPQSLPVRRHTNKANNKSKKFQGQETLLHLFVHVCQIPEELELSAEPFPVAPGGVQTAQDIHRAPDQRGGPLCQGKNIPAAFAQFFYS